MSRIFFIGDLHGNADWIYALDNRLEEPLEAADWVVLLGDSGLNYWTDEHHQSMKKKLNRLGCQFFVVRGNHEARTKDVKDMNSLAWEEISESDDKLIIGSMYREKKYAHIYYAEDCVAAYKINEYDVLVIPGAYSVDKYYRLQMGYNWYPTEQLNAAERAAGLELATSKNHWDFILSHTCPISLEPTDLFLSMINQSSVDKTMELYLEEIKEKTNYNFWLWGHYHAQRIYPYRPGEGQHIMLYCEQALEFNNIIKGNYWMGS